MSRLTSWLLFLLLLCFGIVSWATNNAPALNFPLGPELLGIAIGLTLLAYGWRYRDRSLQSNLFSGTLLGLIMLTLVTLVRAIVSFAEMERVHPLCSVMPGVTQQVECVFQAATNQNLSIRTASYFVTAMVIFIGSYAASRRSPRLIAAAIFTPAVIFTAATLIMHHSGWRLGPALESLFAGDFRESRMCYLIGNPTWITPYLAPGLVIGAAFVLNAGVRLANKVVVTAILVTMLYLQLRTQQRGSLLVVGLYLGTLGLGTLFGLLQFIRKKSLGWLSRLSIAGIWVALYGATLYLSYEPISKLLAAWGFGDRLASTSWASAERSAIWQGAWSGMPGHWWSGHGYGTWYREGAPLAAQFGFYDVLDTAHNFFVQLGFELGAVQLLGLLLCIALLLLNTWRAAKNRALASRMLGVVVAVYLPILAVQEIDFVRSVYMINALSWGWLVADGFGFSSSQPPRPYSKTARRTVAALAAVVFVGALLTTRYFSLAGYQYEANARTDYKPTVRWLRPYGTMTFVDRKAYKAGLYAVYSILQLNTDRYRYVAAGTSTPEEVVKPAKGQSYLPVAARFLGRGPDLFEASGYTLDNGRHISAMLEWPPKLSMLPLRWSEGLYGWESLPSLFGDASVQWCGKTCSIKLAACENGSAVRELKLGAMRQDISAREPLLVDVTVGDKSSPPLIDGPQITFDASEQIVTTNVPTMVEVSITVSRTIRPPQDSRDLGILLISGVCP